MRDRFPHPYRALDAEEWLKLVRNDSPPLNFAIEDGGEAFGGIGLIRGKDVDRVYAITRKEARKLQSIDPA